MATAIISDKFRIFNATQFLESISEGTTDGSSDRSKIYFFVGRSSDWYATIEIFNVRGGTGNFTVGNEVYVGTNYGSKTWWATIVEVSERTLTVEGVFPSSASTPRSSSGNGLLKEYNGTADTGVQAQSGQYNYSNESSPEQAIDNQEYKQQVYDDLIAAKRITNEVAKPGFARSVIDRYNYISGQNLKWDMWRPDYTPTPGGTAADQGFVGKEPNTAGTTSIADARFYVMNEDYEVFKCIDNGEHSTLGIRNSTVTPTQAAANARGYVDTRATDGYLWKYMYTILTTDVLRFLSTDFMPVVQKTQATRVATEGIAVPGSVEVVVLAEYNSVTGGTLTLADANTTNVTRYAPVVGDGTGAVVELVFGAGGALQSYRMVAEGSGYTYGSIHLKSGVAGTSPFFPYGVYNTFSGGVLSAPTTITATPNNALEPIMSPEGGHGSNMEIELNAKRVMTNIRLTYAEGSGDFPVDNDFRRIGLLRDPIDASTSSVALLDTYSLLKAVKIQNGDDNYLTAGVGEEITQTKLTGEVAKGRVVSWTNDAGSPNAGVYSGVLKYFQSPIVHTDRGRVFPFGGTTSIEGTTSGASGTINTGFSGVLLGATFTSGLASAELTNNSGEIIYVENRRLITRAADQIEDIKLVIEF